MKKYIKMLPVILYPYFYVIYLACIFFMSGINENLMDMVLDAVPVIAIVYFVKARKKTIDSDVA